MHRYKRRGNNRGIIQVIGKKTTNMNRVLLTLALFALLASVAYAKSVLGLDANLLGILGLNLDLLPGVGQNYAGNAQVAGGNVPNVPTNNVA
ncbi:hypothetical protein O3G_MSEX009879 [Manduca sexta]|uniref:Uncharacterized protein n=1 Tax=Manduca sexta TaxID=7130 RepID=A0A921ZFI8_MANSE|nr:hypothetical protein O3G_MSEX009879 [Manduca sexta]